MNIKILGAGCAKCRELEKTVRDVVKTLQVDASVEDVTDMKQIMQYHVMATPGLVINEKVVSSGKVLARNEVERLIINTLATGEDAGKA